MVRMQEKTKCSAINSRKALKNNPEKYKKFLEKVKINQKHIWEKRPPEYIKKIFLNSVNKTKEINSKLTKEEMRKKYTYNFIGNIEQCIKNHKEGKSGYKANMKGKFKPNHPEKYKGDVKNIIYRSSWEAKFLMKLDNDPDVISYSSEEIFIWYLSPIDNKWHRYFPDMIYETKSGKKIMVEIKPHFQTVPPTISESKKKSNKYIKEVMTWGINQAKWKYAIEYCNKRGIEFQILTEKELNIKAR